MSTNIENRTGGIGISGLLFCVFVALKLGLGETAVMGWSWWWVCAPIWLPVALLLPIALIALFIMWADVLKPTFPFSRKKFSKVKKLRKSFQKHNIDFEKFAVEMDKVIDAPDRFNLMDFDDEVPIKKSIRRHEKKVKKDRFSLKKWWKEGCQGDTLFQKVVSWYRKGNKKVAEKKALKSENKS